MKSSVSRNYKKIVIGGLVLAIIAISVGYAALSTNLKIDGSATAKSNSWNIHFDNLTLDDINTVTGTQSITNDTSVSFNATLSKPGDYYGLSVDVVNEGTIDAMINTISKTTLTEEQSKYLDLEISYSDGVEISKKDKLVASTGKETISISLSYKDDVDASDLPTTDTPITINFNMEYVQADDTAVEINSGTNLYNLMKTAASSDSINFSVNSATSGTNGIYTTNETDSGNPVYYYRGSYTALNNNLIFNNMCWKIIRTTETGGVKLIYNGTPTDGKCETQTGDTTQIGTSVFNTNYADNAFVGYMYGTIESTTYEATHANINDSEIKTYIDNWYTTNFNATVTAKIEDTVFCSDRSTVTGTNNNTFGSSLGTLGYGANKTGYGALARASYYTKIPSPSLKCSKTNDKFTVSTSNGNGALTNPVGLITLDEVVFAGFNTYESNGSDYYNKTNYLYTNSYYWTLSPVHTSGGAAVGYVYNTGYVGMSHVHRTSGVRPVISLVSSTTVTGEGTTTNPYIVK